MNHSISRCFKSFRTLGAWNNIIVLALVPSSYISMLGLISTSRIAHAFQFIFHRRFPDYWLCNISRVWKFTSPNQKLIDSLAARDFRFQQINSNNLNLIQEFLFQNIWVLHAWSHGTKGFWTVTPLTHLQLQFLPIGLWLHQLQIP